MFRARQELGLFLRKILLLITFLVIYTLICRAEEFLFVRSWESNRIVDPSSLNIRTLTSVLACRGIHTRGVFEREDLLAKVRSSGPLTNLEVVEAIRAQINPLSAGPTEERKPEEIELEVGASEFSTDEEFNDLTEHSAWVIEVRQDDTPTISLKTWYRLSRFLKVFDIRMGRLLCNKYRNICESRAFFHSGLLLVSPKDRNQRNRSVQYSWYSSIMTMPRILSWLEAGLSKRVQSLDDSLSSLEEVESSSLTSGHFIVALRFDRLTDIPLLFSALSVRFDGLIQFWRLTAAKARVLFGSEDRNSTDGTFFFINGNIHYEYGRRPDWNEITTYRAIEFFLKTNYPDSNDILKKLAFLVCLLALLSIVINPCDSFDKAFGYCIRSFLINVYFFIFYLSMAYILSMRNMHNFRSVLILLYQSVSLSELGGILRRDYFAGRFFLPRVFFSFIVFLIISIVIMKSCRSVKEDATSEHPKKPKLKNRNVALSRNILKQECSICQEYCRLDEILRNLGCGHAFHQRCIEQWLLTKNSCPKCCFPIKES